VSGRGGRLPQREGRDAAGGPAEIDELVIRLGDVPSPARRQERLLSIPDRGVKRVVLDLSGVQSIEASTLGTILLLRQALREHGGGVRLRGCSAAVSSVLQSLHLEHIVCTEG